MATRSEGPDARPPGAQGPNLVVLWVVVTGLWTAATIFRMQRAWAPVMAWHTIFGSAYTWVTLFVPSGMFAIILLAVRRLAMPRGRS
jgi:hypothetical protein